MDGRASAARRGQQAPRAGPEARAGSAPPGSGASRAHEGRLVAPANWGRREVKVRKPPLKRHIKTQIGLLNEWMNSLII